MSAKEMFEELGYELYVNHKTELSYRNKNLSTDFVIFDKKEKEYAREFIFVGGSSSSNYINMKLNKAIQQQIKELDWESDI
jgi:uncharacterized FAD-dependent dehydrogenase